MKKRWNNLAAFSDKFMRLKRDTGCCLAEGAYFWRFYVILSKFVRNCTGFCIFVSMSIL